MNTIYTLQNNKKLNAQEFIYYFEHKVLYTIRKYELLDKKQKQNLNIQDLLIKNKINKTSISHECLDDISLNILKTFMKKNAKKDLKNFLPLTIKNKKKIIRPFYFISQKELDLYAKLKKIKQQKKPIKKTDLVIIYWLDSLEQKHPEVKNAIVNSLLKIEKFL